MDEWIRQRKWCVVIGTIAQAMLSRIFASGSGSKFGVYLEIDGAGVRASRLKVSSCFGEKARRSRLGRLGDCSGMMGDVRCI